MRERMTNYSRPATKILFIAKTAIMALAISVVLAIKEINAQP